MDFSAIKDGMIIIGSIVALLTYIWKVKSDQDTEFRKTVQSLLQEEGALASASSHRLANFFKEKRFWIFQSPYRDEILHTLFGILQNKDANQKFLKQGIIFSLLKCWKVDEIFFKNFIMKILYHDLKFEKIRFRFRDDNYSKNFPLCGADLAGSEFNDCDLVYVDFSYAVLISCKFTEGCNLSHTILHSTRLYKTKFRHCNFYKAQLINIRTEGTLFECCKFEEVSFKKGNDNPPPTVNHLTYEPSFNKITFKSCFFNKAMFENIEFTNCTFLQCDCNDIKIKNVKFHQCDSDSQSFIDCFPNHNIRLTKEKAE